MRIAFLFFYLFGIQLTVSGQAFRVVAQLPPVLEETSGIALAASGGIWSFNDSGGEPVLYRCDTLGQLVQEVVLRGASNVDWEDMTADTEGHLYVGDFGNNANKRKDLRIYKLSEPSEDAQAADVELITFRFEDQEDFPPEYRRFDCESVIWRAGHLYLFTKHRDLPMATNLYRIPDSSGDYVAERLGSFETGEPSSGEHALFDYWITAADISPDGERVALLSGNKVWLFSGFEEDHFLDGEVEVISLGQSSQKEGLCFLDDRRIYITDEYWSTFQYGRNLYELSLPKPTSTSIAVDTEAPSFYPNPCSSHLLVDRPSRLTDLFLLSPSGQTLSADVQGQEISLLGLPYGFYTLMYRIDGGPWRAKSIIKM